MARRRHPAGTRGFGLVEIMISLVLGLLLIAAAIQVFLGTEASTRYNEGLATLQDNARFALHVLERDLRMTGYGACPKALSQAPSVTERGGSRYGRVSAVGDVTVNDENLMADPVHEPTSADLPDDAAGDALQVGYMRDAGVRLTTGASDGDESLSVNLVPASWKADQLALVTDCRKAELFRLGSDSAIGAKSSSFSNGYSAGSRVVQPYSVIYFIGDTSQTDDSGNPVQALYRRQMLPAEDATAEQLVIGITNLTLRYGVDTIDNSDPPTADEYVNAASVGDWSNVGAVRVGFIAESERQARGADGSNGADDLSIFDSTISDLPDDGHLRRVFTTTVAVRNRVVP